LWGTKNYGGADKFVEGVSALELPCIYSSVPDKPSFNNET